MVDLRANPYFLSDEDVQWVEQTAAAMTEDEKIWQLFADPLMGRDQHIVEGNNGLSCEAWDATFGKVYQHCIDRGVPTIMVGHFTLPAYQKKLNPALRDADMTTACTAARPSTAP